MVLSRHGLAGSPMVVDDANVATAGNCQVESWMRAGHGERDAWLVPACNPQDNLEWALGLNQRNESAAADARGFSLQAKTLLQPLEGHARGAGLAVGAVWQQEGDAALQSRSLYAYVPVSVAYAGERGELHVNLGVQEALHDAARDDPQAEPMKTTWGLGTSFVITRRSSVLAEVYGEGRDDPVCQAGLRVGLLPDRLELDATVSASPSSRTGTTLYSLGLRWLDVFPRR
jgi:hypothetical protein